MTYEQGQALLQAVADLETRCDQGLPAAGQLPLLFWWLMVLTLAVLALVFFEGLKVYRDW